MCVFFFFLGGGGDSAMWGCLNIGADKGEGYYS